MTNIDSIQKNQFPHDLMYMQYTYAYMYYILQLKQLMTSHRFQVIQWKPKHQWYIGHNLLNISKIYS